MAGDTLGPDLTGATRLKPSMPGDSKAKTGVGVGQPSLQAQNLIISSLPSSINIRLLQASAEEELISLQRGIEQKKPGVPEQATDVKF